LLPGMNAGVAEEESCVMSFATPAGLVDDSDVSSPREATEMITARTVTTMANAMRRRWT